MPRIKVRFEVEPRGSVYFSGADAAYPGWYLKHGRGGKQVTVRLHCYDEIEADRAVMEAANLLGCVPDAIRLDH